MKLSRPVDYAMRLCVDLALHADTTDVKSVAARQNAPPHYLAKIAQQLALAGIITTMRGAHGGIGLAVDPSQITLLHIWEAVEGPVSFAKCKQWPKECCKGACPYHEMLQGLGSTITGYLGAITVGDLAEKATIIQSQY